MIAVTDYKGIITYLHPDAIASVTESDASSQWHGIRSYIICFDGKTIACQETAQVVSELINREPQP